MCLRFWHGAGVHGIVGELCLRFDRQHHINCVVGFMLATAENTHVLQVLLGRCDNAIDEPSSRFTMIVIFVFAVYLYGMFGVVVVVVRSSV